MLWIRTLAVALIAAVAVSAEDKKPDDKKPADFDAKALLGKWTVSEGMKAGEKSDVTTIKDPADFTADKITLKTPDATFVFKYSVDPKMSPVAVEFEILEPEGFKGAMSKGIIMVDGEKMMLAYNPTPEGARPKDFKSTKDNGSHVFTFAKTKKKDDK